MTTIVVVDEADNNFARSMTGGARTVPTRQRSLLTNSNAAQRSSRAAQTSAQDFIGQAFQAYAGCS
jgi:hypothetical protein